MVTSAAVPEVVETAMMGRALFLVGEAPSRERTSANSGLVRMTAMALLVSMALPPPTATIRSAPSFWQKATPSWTFWMVGLALMPL